MAEFDTWVSIVIAIFASVMASSGFWVYIQSRGHLKSSTTKLLMGLAHDRIIHVGTGYIVRGWVTYAEYEDFMVYLYEPYQAFGGNGLAQKVVEDVKRLPIRQARVLRTIGHNIEGEEHEEHNV